MSERDTTVMKVNSQHSPHGALGQKYLASGKNISMRLFERADGSKHEGKVRREYETVGYVISGRAKLHIEGQTIVLEPGDSWVVPKGAEHEYEIQESFTAVEATYPPAQVHGRDE
jgi:quercetin dioxygenase-like cupin family protein